MGNEPSCGKYQETHAICTRCLREGYVDNEYTSDQCITFLSSTLHDKHPGGAYTNRGWIKPIYMCNRGHMFYTIELISCYNARIEKYDRLKKEITVLNEKIKKLEDELQYYKQNVT